MQPIDLQETSNEIMTNAKVITNTTPTPPASPMGSVRSHDHDKGIKERVKETFSKVKSSALKAKSKIIGHKKNSSRSSRESQDINFDNLSTESQASSGSNNSRAHVTFADDQDIAMELRDSQQNDPSTGEEGIAPSSNDVIPTHVGSEPLPEEPENDESNNSDSINSSEIQGSKEERALNVERDAEQRALAEHAVPRMPVPVAAPMAPFVSLSSINYPMSNRC